MENVKAKISEVLAKIATPKGENLISADLVRALTVSGGEVSFVIEVEDKEVSEFNSILEEAKKKINDIDGVSKVSIVLTSHSKEPKVGSSKPPKLTIGGHPKPQNDISKVQGVDRIIAIASGKGGVGKSTLSSNLAVALSLRGRRVGLLDADIYGPSQPKMMGINSRPSSPDGKTIIPIIAHGVKMMSIGLMLADDQAVIWRGPMLMGALQQMLGQVQWGNLDVLIVDLPPGTGDVQLTLAQKTKITGAIIISTPQDIALLDARKALNMFEKTKTPVLGMIENMSTYVCPKCGQEADIFGSDGVKKEAEKHKLPFLGHIPLDVKIRLSSDQGEPLVNLGSTASSAFMSIAEKLIQGDMA